MKWRNTSPVGGEAYGRGAGRDALLGGAARGQSSVVMGRTSTTFGTLYSLIVLVMTSTANRSVTNHQICRPSARVLALKYGAFREALLTFFDFPAEHLRTIYVHQIRSRACSRRCGIEPCGGEDRQKFFFFFFFFFQRTDTIPISPVVKAHRFLFVAKGGDSDQRSIVSLSKNLDRIRCNLPRRVKSKSKCTNRLNPSIAFFYPCWHKIALVNWTTCSGHLQTSRGIQQFMPYRSDLISRP